MDVWEKLYNAYSSGELFLPPIIYQKSTHDLKDFVNKFITDPEDEKRFERLFGDFCIDLERQYFHAGMSIALRLFSE